MSDEQRQSEPREAQIPDGGLGTAMPAWLQQPPVWKREPVEIPAPARTLPPPDESVIDPRTMLDIDDLPRWLQDLAPSSSGKFGPGAVDHEPDADLGDEDPAPDSGLAEAVSVEATLRGRPLALDPRSSDVSGEFRADMESAPINDPVSIPRITDGVAPGRTPPWWLSDRVLGLVLLGIVLAMIYVVLAVSGVV